MIYVLKSADHVKIGYTKDFTKRLGSYKSSNPTIEVIAEYDEGTLFLEQYIHKNFKKAVHGREWYDYTESFLEEFDVFYKQVLDKFFSHIDNTDIFEYKGAIFHGQNVVDAGFNFLSVRHLINSKVNQSTEEDTCYEFVGSSVDNPSLYVFMGKNTLSKELNDKFIYPMLFKPNKRPL